MTVGCCRRVNHMAVITTIYQLTPGNVNDRTESWLGWRFCASRYHTESNHVTIVPRSTLRNQENTPKEDLISAFLENSLTPL
jgi:hypothetical protein